MNSRDTKPTKKDLEETIFILSNQSLTESIKEGLKTPIKDCVSELPW